MNIFTKIKDEIYFKYYDIRERFYTIRYRLKYPDYIEDDTHYGSLEHIWGITSYDNLTGREANLHTMNDIDITYEKDNNLYMLGIETIYQFNEPEKENQCKYLRRLLDEFTKFMDENDYSKGFDVWFHTYGSTKTSAESIEELYMNFKIFVEGYCKVYGF